MRRSIWLLFLCAAGLTAGADRIEWSDGTAWEGTVRLPAAGGLRFHDGRQVREWPLAEVAAIEWMPATQRMERAWRFIEAGKTAKEYTGGSYPTMELNAVVTLQDGADHAGHLMTTVLYLEEPQQTRKLVVKHKLVGEAGTTPADLLYPRRLTRPPAPSGRRTRRLLMDGAPFDEVALAARWPVTAAVPLRREAERFLFDQSGEAPVLAVRRGRRIDVGWGNEAGADMRRRLQTNLGHVRDFFDRFDLIAVASNAADAEVAFSLVLAWREGRTTMSGDRTQPWRLEVWRWRLGEGGQDLLAARAVLMRGIRGRDAPLPEVKLAPWAVLPPEPAEVRLKAEG